MRLRKLDLIRFGCFTNHTIDFGKLEAGEPDIHVIFGDNESGKSTIFSAYLDLLFGIKPQSPYGFLHPYETMQIMATLEQDNVARTITRIKKPQFSLLDGQGDILPEGTLAPYLNGLTREQCLAMFSMDDDSIEKGGEDILASKGETGALLFAASTGLSNFSETLGKLGEEADTFHKKAGRKTHIKVLKEELQSLKDEKAKFDVQVNQYERCRKERDAAQNIYDTAETQRRKLGKDCDDINRQLRALPLNIKLNELAEKLRPLEKLKAPKPTWKGQARKLEQDLAQLETRRSDLTTRHNKLKLSFDGLARDTAALPLKEEVDGLQEMHASFLTAERDLPTRRDKRSLIGRDIADVLAELGRQSEANPKGLVLTDGSIRKIRELIASRSGFNMALASAAKESADAKNKLIEHDEMHPTAEASGADGSFDTLAALTASLESQETVQLLRNAKQDMAQKKQEFYEAIDLLMPWRGEAQTLEGMQVPSSLTLRDWSKQKDALESKRANLATKLDEVARECIELRSTRDSLNATGTFTTDEELAELRGRREAAWSAHLAHFDISTAKTFEELFRLHDAVTERRIGQMLNAADVQAAVQQLLKAEDKFDEETQKQGECDSQLTSLMDTYAAWRDTIGFPAGFAVMPDELETWLEKRMRALAIGVIFSRAETQMREKSDIASEACQRMQRALADVHLPCEEKAPLDELLNVARTVVQRSQQRRLLQDTRTKLQTDVKMRERYEAVTRQEVETWNNQWQETLDNTWLGGMEARSPTDVSDILSQLDVLKILLHEHTDLEDRIQKMEQDKQRFAVALHELSTKFSMPQGSLAPLAHFKAMGERAENAQAAQKEEDRLQSELKDWKNDKDIFDAAEAPSHKMLKEMTTFYEVTTLEEVCVCISNVEERDELADQVKQTELELLRDMQSTDLAACRASLSAMNRQDLGAELVKVQEQWDGQDTTCKDRYAEVRKAQDKLDVWGGDDLAARLEQQARTKCLEIEDKVLNYVRLKAGIMATERALTLYREKHQSSMMQAASQTFAQITNGRYVRLQSQPSKDTEELVAVARDGSSKAAHQMSKGTRFQLYLALRAAGYQEFSKTRSPLPFIADDILETFDDKRSSRTFELLAGMSQNGQVIYLAHHRHLCEMAGKLIPNVKIHELPDSPS